MAREHLAACPGCAGEVARMREISGLFPALVSSEEFAPVTGFSARVLMAIEERRGSSFWDSLIAPVVFRRVAFASLLLLATLGGYLATTESEFRAGVTPEIIMAAERSAPPSEYGHSGDRDFLMATLATYQPGDTE